MYLVINIFGDGEIQYGDWGGGDTFNSLLYALYWSIELQISFLPMFSWSRNEMKQFSEMTVYYFMV